MISVKQLSPKKIRTFKRDIATFFKPSNYFVPKTSDDYKKINVLSPHFERDSTYYYFNEIIKSALTRIVDISIESLDLLEIATFDEVYQTVKNTIQKYAFNDINPSVEDLLNDVNNEIYLQVSNFTHTCRIEGLKLQNIERISFEKYEIKFCTAELIESLFDNEQEELKSAVKEYDNSLIITGEIKGTHSRSQKVFYNESELVLSSLLLYQAILTDGKIENVYLRLLNNCFGGFEKASSIAHSKDNGSTLTVYFKSQNEILFDEEMLEYINNQCFFNYLPDILMKKDKSKFEESITRAIYWLGEAIKDTNNTTAFIKMWSCAESLFTINNEEITEKNAMGIVGLLTYGGFNVLSETEYTNEKSKIKKMYQLRSKAIHRGSYTDINNSMRSDFSFMISWVVVTIVGLHAQGFKEMQEILKKIIQLENKICRKTSTVPLL